jgi:carbon-monoxide dehydrogenase medium subunit
LEKLEVGRVPDVAALLDAVYTLALQDQPVVLMAGGSDFLATQSPETLASWAERPPFVIEIAGLPELCVLREADGFLQIGACVPFEQLAKVELISLHAPLLAELARSFDPKAAERATLGGNLAKRAPHADGLAVLSALDAELVVTGRDGPRSLSIEQFVTSGEQAESPLDELITRIDLPLPSALENGVRVNYWRKVADASGWISKVALAASATKVNGELVRCGLGMASVGARTALMTRTRELYLSTPLSRIRTQALEKAVDADIAPLTDAISTSVYRAHVARALVVQFHQRALAA